MLQYNNTSRNLQNVPVIVTYPLPLLEETPTFQRGSPKQPRTQLAVPILKYIQEELQWINQLEQSTETLRFISIYMPSSSSREREGGWFVCVCGAGAVAWWVWGRGEEGERESIRTVQSTQFIVKSRRWQMRNKPSGSCKSCEAMCFLSKASAKSNSFSPPSPHNTCQQAQRKQTHSDK